MTHTRFTFDPNVQLLIQQLFNLVIRFIFRGRMTLWCKGTTPSWESMPRYGEFLLVVLFLLSFVADVNFFSYKLNWMLTREGEADILLKEWLLENRCSLEDHILNLESRGHLPAYWCHCPPGVTPQNHLSSSFSGRRWIASTAATAVLFSTSLLLKQIGSQLQCSSLLEPGLLNDQLTIKVCFFSEFYIAGLIITYCCRSWLQHCWS